MFLVPGLNPSDPLSFLTVAAVLGAVGLPYTKSKCRSPSPNSTLPRS